MRWELLILIVPAALYLWLALLASRSQQDERERIARSGISGQAEILSYERDGDGCWVTYRFTPRGSDVPIECRKAMSAAAKRFPFGSLVSVR